MIRSFFATHFRTNLCASLRKEWKMCGKSQRWIEEGGDRGRDTDQGIKNVQRHNSDRCQQPALPSDKIDKPQVQHQENSERQEAHQSESWICHEGDAGYQYGRCKGGDPLTPG